MSIASPHPVRLRLQTVRSILEDHYFDRKYGVETQSRVAIGRATGVVGSNAAHGLAYHPTRGRHLKALWKRLRLPPGLGLLDVGCGKGLVLLHGAQEPFRRIVGVEYAESLVSVAHQNVRRFQANAGGSTPIEVIHADAGRWAIPVDLHVIYLFNPFSETVFAQVMDRVHDSYARVPRAMWVVVNKASYDAAVCARGVFSKTAAFRYGSAEMHIYRSAGS